MSVFGITNYLLVTQKGRTYIPFVRGTGFLIDYSQYSFYTKHVITASHVASPLRFPSLFGHPPVFQRIGERHLTPKLIMFHPETGKRRAMLPLEPTVSLLKGTAAASLRVRGERDLWNRMAEDGVHVPVPVELDLPSNEVGEGEPLVLRGLELDRDEEGADVAEMKQVDIPAAARISFVSNLFGPTVIVSTGKRRVTAGMSGCPVLRKSNGKCVGMLIAGVKTRPTTVTNNASRSTTEDRSGSEEAEEEALGLSPSERRKKSSIFNEERLPKRVNDDAAMNLAMQEFEMAHRNLEPPCLDLVGQDETLAELGCGSDEQFAAFVPIKDFLGPLRFAENL